MPNEASDQLCSACYTADIQGIEKSLGVGADINYKDGEPLIYLIRGGASNEAKMRAINCLESKGANLAARDSIALTWAIRTKNTELVKFLLNKISAPKDSDAIVFEAVVSGNREALELLLKAGCRISEEMISLLSHEQHAFLEGVEAQLLSQLEDKAHAKPSSQSTSPHGTHEELSMPDQGPHLPNIGSLVTEFLSFVAVLQSYQSDLVSHLVSLITTVQELTSKIVFVPKETSARTIMSILLQDVTTVLETGGALPPLPMPDWSPFDGSDDSSEIGPELSIDGISLMLAAAASSLSGESVAAAADTAHQ